MHDPKLDEKFSLQVIQNVALVHYKQLEEQAEHKFEELT